MEYQALHATPWLHGSFWVFIAIVIFAVLAGRQIIGALTGMLDARTESVKMALAEAAQLKAEAEAMLEAAKARQQQAAEDARHILETAAAEAQRLAVELAEEARAAAARRERMALERIAAAEANALREVRAAAIDIATAALSGLLRDEFGPEADARLQDRAIANIPTALRQPV